VSFGCGESRAIAVSRAPQARFARELAAGRAHEIRRGREKFCLPVLAMEMSFGHIASSLTKSLRAGPILRIRKPNIRKTIRPHRAVDKHSAADGVAD
jgi:hypothetical protein